MDATRLLYAACCWACLSPLLFAQKPAAQPADSTKARPQAELEQEFAERLSNAVMQGSFTVTGSEDDKAPHSDKYTLGKVKKLKGDTWLFETRIQYGDKDVKLPIMVQVKWAGDTPVITLTDMEVPGLGKFTSRVVVYKDQYAGTWSGADHGGHLYGTISSGGEDSDATTPDDDEAEQPEDEGE